MKKEMDFKNFWRQDDYYTKNYVEAPLTDDMIAFAEKKLGYKLPQSYLRLMKTQNGGGLKKTYWFNEYAKIDEVDGIGLSGFLGIGGKKKRFIWSIWK